MGRSRRCWVPDCDQKNPKLFTFPGNVERCLQWLQAIGDEQLALCSWMKLVQIRYICQEHFLPDSFTATGRVKYNAVPTLFKGMRPLLPDSATRTFLQSVPVNRRAEVEAIVGSAESSGLPESCGEETTPAAAPNLNVCAANARTSCATVMRDHDYYSEFSGLEAESIEGSLDSSGPPGSPDLPRGHPTIDPPISTTSESNDALDSLDACENREESFVQFTLYDIFYKKKELCRLCGQRGSVLKPIFETQPSDTFSEIPVFSKIEMYLPMKMKMEDPLPVHICSSCYDVLNHWHEFYVTSVAADAALRKIYGIQTIVSSDEPAIVNESIQEEVHLKAPNIIPDGNSDGNPEIQQEPSELPTPHETTRMGNTPCKEGGEDNAGMLQIEDKLFIAELDRNLAIFAPRRKRSYKCRFCYEFFKNSRDRKEHFAMCRQLSTLCDMCGHEVPCRRDLWKHKYKKHYSKNIRQRFVCDKCGKCYTDPTGLKKHIRNIHESDRSKKYYCELCCTPIMTEIYFRDHKRRHERGEIKSTFEIEAFRQRENSKGLENTCVYSCPVCKEIFSDKLSLMVHLTTQNQMKCQLCHKTVYSEKNLFLHTCGKWTCEYCLKTFDQRVKWIYHERLHTGEKPIRCRICDLTFRTYGSRRLHEESHKPSYECSYCGKRYRSKCRFTDHVMGHEGKEFLCCICEKKFSGRINLKKHLRKMHVDKKIS